MDGALPGWPMAAEPARADAQRRQAVVGAGLWRFGRCRQGADRRDLARCGSKWGKRCDDGELRAVGPVSAAQRTWKSRRTSVAKLERHRADVGRSAREASDHRRGVSRAGAWKDGVLKHTLRERTLNAAARMTPSPMAAGSGTAALGAIRAPAR